MPSSESALVVLVPEPEAVVKPFRDQYDPSAAAGVPAHITLLYPFKAPDEIDDITLGKLRSCFASFKAAHRAGLVRAAPYGQRERFAEPSRAFTRRAISIY